MDTLGPWGCLQGSQWVGCCGCTRPMAEPLLKPIALYPLSFHAREQSVQEGTWKSLHFKLFILNRELEAQQ